MARMMDNKVKICFLTAGRMDYEEFKKRAVAVASIENDIENCFISKPIENEDLIKRVKAQLL